MIQYVCVKPEKVDNSQNCTSVSKIYRTYSYYFSHKVIHSTKVINEIIIQIGSLPEHKEYCFLFNETYFSVKLLTKCVHLNATVIH